MVLAEGYNILLSIFKNKLTNNKLTKYKLANLFKL
jgi:hypothetical protein